MGTHQGVGGVRMVGPLAHAPGAFRLEHPALHQVRDPPNDEVHAITGRIRLDCEALCPELLPRFCRCQLRIDAQRTVQLAHAACDRIAHAEFLAGALDIDGLPLVGER